MPVFISNPILPAQFLPLRQGHGSLRKDFLNFHDLLAARCLAMRCEVGREHKCFLCSVGLIFGSPLLFGCLSGLFLRLLLHTGIRFSVPTPTTGSVFHSVHLTVHRLDVVLATTQKILDVVALVLIYSRYATNTAWLVDSSPSPFRNLTGKVSITTAKAD